MLIKKSSSYSINKKYFASWIKWLKKTIRCSVPFWYQNNIYLEKAEGDIYEFNP
jgi:hypothetical protein